MESKYKGNVTIASDEPLLIIKIFKQVLPLLLDERTTWSLLNCNITIIMKQKHLITAKWLADSNLIILSN